MAGDARTTHGPDGRFQDKVAFITGGAVGFGRAFARAFCADGAAIVIADMDETQANATASQLRDEGGRAEAVRCDVADEGDVGAAVAKATATLGGIDILVNNAGLHLSKYNQPFSALERGEVRRLFDVNVMGIVNCTLACQASMAARGGGSVVNISSTSADLCLSPYGVSKLTVRGLTRAFAQELSGDGTRVNDILPGLMATENAMADLPRDVIDEQVATRQLVHRLGTMDDVVRAVLFLCSDEASFVTGESLRVSGGFPVRL